MRFPSFAFVVVFASLACGGESASTNQPSNAAGSFAQLQANVLTPSCAVSGCHVGSSASSSGNLVLTADVAYDNLVNAAADDLAARRDGLKRVVPGKPDSSLLFQKVVLA